MHRYHQFGVEGNQDGGMSGSLPRHNSSPPGFFSNPIVDNAYWRDRLKIWGYDPLFLSVDQQSGFVALKEMLEGETTVVVGPNGVGKSSLINALRCNQDISEEDPIHKLVEQMMTFGRNERPAGIRYQCLNMMTEQKMGFMWIKVLSFEELASM